MFKTQKSLLLLISLGVTLATGFLFSATHTGNPMEASAELQTLLGWVSAVGLGVSLFGFAKLFSSDSEEQRKAVAEFFQKLDTPVDVAVEVFGAGKKQVSTFPLVGSTTIVMGLLISLIFFTELGEGEATILAVMIAIMIFFGAFMWYFGKKSEIRSAAQYEQKSQ